MVNRVANLQLAQGHFEHDDRRIILQRFVGDELFAPAFEHIEHRVGERTETAALKQHGFFPKQFAGNYRFTVGGEHRGFGEPLLDELQRHEPVVHAGERRAGKFDHVHFNARAGKVVEQRADEFRRVGGLIKCAVNQVHADDAKRFLLAQRFLVERPNVNDDSRRIAVRMDLEFDAKPAAAFIALGGDGVGENEESAFVAARLVEPLQQQIKFEVEHRLQTRAADVAFGLAVNRVAHGHVVGGNGFCNRPRRLANVEKPARDFLARADLGERAVFLRVEVDLKRFLAGVQFFAIHKFPSLTRYIEIPLCSTIMANAKSRPAAGRLPVPLRNLCRRVPPAVRPLGGYAFENSPSRR